jgi:hypothetical protein
MKVKRLYVFHPFRNEIREKLAGSLILNFISKLALS